MRLAVRADDLTKVEPTGAFPDRSDRDALLERHQEIGLKMRRSRLRAAIVLAVTSTVPLMVTSPVAASTIQFRSASRGSGATLIMSKPVGVVAGDVLVAGIAKHQQVSGGGYIKSPPSWKLVSDTTLTDDLELAVYVKTAHESEPASYTWRTGDEDANGLTVAYSGADPADPVVALGQGAQRRNTREIRIQSFDVPTNNSMLVMFATIEGPSDNFIHPPARFTPRAERAVHPTIAVSDVALASSGPTGDLVACARHAASNVGVAVALRPQASAQPGN